MSDQQTRKTRSPSASRSSRSKRFQDITIINTINQAKFQVLLAFSPSLNHYFALKMFPYLKENTINPCFLNEIRFTKLRHQNIICPIFANELRTIEIPASTSAEAPTQQNISYTLMELAPYGDFFDVLITKKVQFDDKLARTYFHQLVRGLEYLHSEGVAHLDIKPENVLLGNEFQMKIADFDSSALINQAKITSRGTKYYRAPELINQKCKNPIASDVYSAGVLLFLFKCGGALPHLEHEKVFGDDLLDLLYDNNDEFWAKHEEIQRRTRDFFDDDFKSLFNRMVCANADERPSLEEVKSSAWYKGPVYTNEELIQIMEEKINIC